MRDIVRVTPLKDYRLEIKFDNGATAVVDIKPLLDREIFRPLQDESFFAQVEIDRKFGGVLWPNGADICIDWIKAEIERQKPRKMKFA
jgi:hypothetical protein